ncbi:exonuclease domain-containing protein [Arthrobacter psychrolactophilus]
MQGISFTAIDFETANSFRASVCAVGLTKVRAGHVVAQRIWLMKPLPGYTEFDPTQVAVHGITAARVSHLPDWRSAYGPIMDFIGGDALVGHDVSFERSVFAKANEASGFPIPALEFHCTLELARQHLQLPRYSPSDVVAALDIPAYNHHESGDDARASALIAIELARRTGSSTLAELWPSSEKPVAKMPGYYSAGYTRKLADLPKANPLANPEGPFFGQTVVFSGDLAAMARVEAQDAAAAKGATIVNSVTKKVTLVVGAEIDGGTRFSAKVKRAHELAAAGQDIRVIGELDFMRLLGDE